MSAFLGIGGVQRVAAVPFRDALHRDGGNVILG